MVSYTLTPKNLPCAWKFSVMWKRGLSPISHLKCSLDKALEQGMRVLGGTLVLGMELRAYEEGMDRLRELHDLGQAGLGIVTRRYQAGLLEVLGVLGVELVAVAVTLGYKFTAVYLICKSILGDFAVIGTQTHGSALHGGFLLVLHHIYDRMFGIGIDLG